MFKLYFNVLYFLQIFGGFATLLLLMYVYIDNLYLYMYRYLIFNFSMRDCIIFYL